MGQEVSLLVLVQFLVSLLELSLLVLLVQELVLEKFQELKLVLEVILLFLFENHLVMSELEGQE